MELPIELIRLIRSYVISNKISWRADYHVFKLSQVQPNDTLQKYLNNYKQKIFCAIWNPGYCNVAGTIMSGTARQELYFNTLRHLASKEVTLVYLIQDWQGCLTKEDYVTTCFFQHTYR